MKIRQKRPSAGRVFSRMKLTNIYPPYLTVHLNTHSPGHAGTLCVATVLACSKDEAVRVLERTKALFPDAMLIDLSQSDLAVMK